MRKIVVVVFSLVAGSLALALGIADARPARTAIAREENAIVNANIIEVRLHRRSGLGRWSQRAKRRSDLGWGQARPLIPVPDPYYRSNPHYGLDPYSVPARTFGSSPYYAPGPSFDPNPSYGLK